MNFIPLQSYCHVLSSGENLKTLKRAASPISIPCRQSDLDVQYHSWSKVRLGDGFLTPLNEWGGEEWSYLRANPDLGIFWFIPPLLAVAYLQPTSFIGRIFSGLSRVDVALFQKEQSALGWPIGGFRVWKLSKMYHGEKPPPFSLPTQGCFFSCVSPQCTCWHYPTSLWGWEPFTRVWWPVQFHLPRSYGCVFSKKI